MRFGPALKAAVLCALIAGSGVGYVWQKDQILRLGQETKKREILLAKLEYQNGILRRQLDQLYSAPFLEQRIKDLKLGLVMPQHSQKVYLTEPGPIEATNASTARQYASQNQRSLIMP